MTVPSVCPCPVMSMRSSATGIESCSAFTSRRVRISLADRRSIAARRSTLSTYSVNSLSDEVRTIHCLAREKKVKITRSHRHRAMYRLAGEGCVLTLLVTSKPHAGQLEPTEPQLQ